MTYQLEIFGMPQFQNHQLQIRQTKNIQTVFLPRNLSTSNFQKVFKLLKWKKFVKLPTFSEFTNLPTFQISQAWNLPTFQISHTYQLKISKICKLPTFSRNQGGTVPPPDSQLSQPCVSLIPKDTTNAQDA